jgi:hypothetical protein
MCVIIDRPAGVVVTKSMVEAATTRNSDGWGIAITRKNGVIEVVRGFGSKKAFKAVKNAGECPFVFHARLATHGVINVDNCHPFTILDGQYVVIHNGIVDAVPEVWTECSDTGHLAYGIIEPMLNMHPEWFDDGTLAKFVDALAGYSKIVIVRASDGKHCWINRHLGEDYDGLWISNRTCVPVVATVAKIVDKVPAGKKATKGTAKKSVSSSSPWGDWDFMTEAENDDRWCPEPVGDYTTVNQRGLWQMNDLAYCTYHDIVDLCKNDPEGMASLIHDYLDN